MPFITATREDGATLLLNVDRIQYVAYRDDEGQEVLSVIFDTNPPAQGRPGTNEVVVHGQEARRVWQALSSILSL
ncbi:MAG TPA: hypothetical protein VGX48_27465 [Pyrinomonadaceae bacterium]|jgi:hypothetical protein|nr:hypothetical protein [Pyrinomonadaceae bacterium]